MFVFRNYTVENLFPEDTRFSGYDDISYIPEDDLDLVWMYHAPIVFDSINKAQAIKNIEEKLKFVVSRLKSDQTLWVCSLIDIYPVNINDTDSSVKDAINEFNQNALNLESEIANVKYLDLSDYFSNYPCKDWINWRFYFISQMVISPMVAAGFSDWFFNRLNQIKEARKKCLVLDLDNTLWGGILGEDGVDGIKIGGDYPGNTFLYFQEALINLSKSGVILTVCSKNNEQDVIEAWKNNPFIKLNNNYLSAYRINWNNKADNIVELAHELNIGLDSMVFVDDNPTERELVKQQLPMVTVPDFPKRPYDLMELYRDLVDKYFRAHSLTSEDLEKTAQYKANALRASSRKQFSDMTEFIKSLEIKIKVIAANKFNIPRIAQMTQKTNQFNLTTKRYTEADIENFVERGDSVYCISVEDKFGDNGITGAIIIQKKQNKAFIDSLLLSCRILGKGIEDAFFRSIMNQLIKDGIETLESVYIPTQKNSQVADFYDRQGLTLVSEIDGVKNYTIELNKVFEIPEYYNISQDGR